MRYIYAHNYFYLHTNCTCANGVSVDAKNLSNFPHII